MNRTKNKHKGITFLCVQATHGEMLDHVSRNVLYPDGVANLPGTDNDIWSQSVDLSHAIKLARYGWEQGRKLLSHAVKENTRLMRTLPRKSESFDVAGMYPHVPRAIAGDPLNMYSTGDETLTLKPIIRIVMNAAISGAINPKTVIARGAAILSWIDSLESQSIRCEVDVIESGLFRSKNVGVIYSVNVKRADEHLNINRLAFWLAHPSVQRRIFFAAYEREKHLNSSEYGLTPDEIICYGAPTDDVSDSFIGKHSVYLPAMLRNDPDYQSTPSAMAAVERALSYAIQRADTEKLNSSVN